MPYNIEFHVIELYKRFKKEILMPAKSKAQQRIMGMAMAMKEGKMAHSKSPAAIK